MSVHNNNNQAQYIEGVMKGLMRELAQLAPHPDRLNYTGPLFTQIDSQYEPPAEYEGLLGSMVLESFLGTAFAGASGAQAGHSGWSQSFLPAIDYGSAIEATSLYMQDRHEKRSVRLGQKSAIKGAFNKSSTWHEMMAAYRRDLPKRLGIERWLAEYQRKIYALRKHAPIHALSA